MSALGIFSLSYRLSFVASVGLVLRNVFLRIFFKVHHTRPCCVIQVFLAWLNQKRRPIFLFRFIRILFFLPFVFVTLVSFLYSLCFLLSLLLVGKTLPKVPRTRDTLAGQIFKHQCFDPLVTRNNSLTGSSFTLGSWESNLQMRPMYGLVIRVPSGPSSYRYRTALAKLKSLDKGFKVLACSSSIVQCHQRARRLA